MLCGTGQLYLLVNSCTLTKCFPVPAYGGRHWEEQMQQSSAAAGQARSQISLDCWQVRRVEAESQLSARRLRLMSDPPVPVFSSLSHLFHRQLLLKCDSRLVLHLALILSDVSEA